MKGTSRNFWALFEDQDVLDDKLGNRAGNAGEAPVVSVFLTCPRDRNDFSEVRWPKSKFNPIRLSRGSTMRS